ncbi:AAA family ATPase [Elizabethkingia anophelis]|uniref:AAA family ATPase n=1 Tax=Elizabethkingia anophelis TaxID=1117645 RepID=UPI003891E8A6
MKFWHLQMNQPWGRKSIYINSRDMLEEEVPIIGTGDWDDNQFYNFINADGNGLNNEDIVLVREGKNPIALCKVISDTFSDDELQKKYKNQNFRKVKVLAFYDDTAKQILNKKLEEFDKSFIQASGTFTKCVNKNATNNFIEDWYNQVIKMGKIKERINILDYKKQIILQGPPGTGKTREAKLIAKEILELNSTDDLKDNEQFKLIQFHPSYTYEDFVRGIVAESKGDKIEYKNVNKTLGEFAELALKNYNDSKKNVNELSTEKWIDDEFTQFVDEISQTLEKEKIVLSDNVDLVDLMDDAFLYIGENWKGYEHRMSFKDIKRAYLDNNITRQDIVKNINLSGSARQHATYYIVVLKKFREFLSGKKAPTNQTKINEQKYILVIDEINRANLSSVLGELIYALEYRGKAVESMYSVENSILNHKNQLILPDNLYIIGTMNTADRSVGHIDYAIRRRFAFVDVLPEKLEDNDEIFINTSDFIDVAKLFIKVGEDQVLDFEKAENSDFLSDDFSAKDVALGHSYFIAEKKKISEDNKQEYFNMKMKYEVIPILNEYLKDGVFNEKATVKIKEIEQRFA